MSMTIGVPKEIKDQEFRVALTPQAVRGLVAHGYRVVVQRGAGREVDFPHNSMNRLALLYWLMPTVPIVKRSLLSK